MNFTTIHYAVTENVVTITLDRPAARNALNRTMCEELIEAATAAAAAESVQLVLVRANGPVFCAGADLKERKDMSVDEVRNRLDVGLPPVGTAPQDVAPPADVMPETTPPGAANPPNESE